MAAAQTDTPSFDVDKAFAYCEKVTHDHYENFPVASFFIPAEKRKHICAIYAFARAADDFADEPGLSTPQRIQQLDRWEKDLDDCYQRKPNGPVFVALRETISQYNIPTVLLRNLLQAFKSDVTTKHHETFADVLRYCTHSANPVGRLVLLLFGYRDEMLMNLSDCICTALQLTNFWQDVTVDLEKDRVYLPLEDLRRFGVSEDMLLSRSPTPEFRKLLEFQVGRTRRMFLDGQPLLNLVGKDLRRELRFTWLGGMQILKKIENGGYDVMTKRHTLNFFDKVALLTRILKPGTMNLEPGTLNLL